MPSLDSRCTKLHLIAICLWFVGCLLFIPTLSLAADDTATSNAEAPGLSDYIREVDHAETLFKNDKTNTEALKDSAKKALVATTYAKGCITENEARLLKIDADMEVLGKVDANIKDAMAVPRRELGQQKKDIEKVLAQCRLLNLRGTDLLAQMQKSEQDTIKQLLFAKTPSLLHYSMGIVSQPLSLQQEVTDITQGLVNLPVDRDTLFSALVYGLLGMLVGLFWSLYTQNYTQTNPSNLIKTSPALATVWNSIIRVSPGLLLFGLVYLRFLYSPMDAEVVNDKSVDNIALTLLVFTVSYTILRAMLKPNGNLEGFAPLLPNASRKLFYWWRFLLLVTLLGALFQSAIFDTEPPGNLVGLIRISLGTLVGLALMRVVWLLRKHLLFVKRFYLSFLSIGLILVAIGALGWGYRNFSIFLFRGVFGTFFILLLGWLLVRIPAEIFDSMDAGAGSWQKKLRKRMSLTSEQIIPGLIWLRLVHMLVVGGVIIIALLRLWGMSEQRFNLLKADFISGYKIGEFTLEPLSILSGFLILSFGVLLTQFIKRSLTKNWLRRTNLSRGASEATVTITGYTGITLAFFMGLSVAGIDFGNLAIIAGALSLGIGFGLQNIVNNFISGLILLFERPIRRGDWIRTGASEGYVKDISIRSTVIQTFDRADIIVPNSELISNQVTNMMLNNQFGRIIIPVRVAYGTNTELVIDTLRGVAEINSNVLREEGKLQIQALFRSFGETAMNFELRVHIKEVENVLVITSELNLAIDKAFRKAGIEIPLPRQIVYLEREEQNSEQEQSSQP